jgi:hypothetical protein
MARRRMRQSLKDMASPGRSLGTKRKTVTSVAFLLPLRDPGNPEGIGRDTRGLRKARKEQIVTTLARLLRNNS